MAHIQPFAVNQDLTEVGYLQMNVRTLENWEQARAKPNAQAALLINLVKRFPDTLARLASI